MPRIVSVWLEGWPITRLLLAQGKKSSGPQSDAIGPDRPLALVAPGKGGARLVALNAAAQSSGLIVGELLSNARSKVLDLHVREADPAADAVALDKLALWCQRYTPLVMPWDQGNGTDGLFLDITGCAHLFGGETKLLSDLARRLTRFGLTPRLAIASTAGAAWGLARFGEAKRVIVPPGEDAQAIPNLPLAALRLSGETLGLLQRLGFRRIGDLMHKPRAPLTARFGTKLLRRLDQALGHVPEPLAPVSARPRYHTHVTFVEPIQSTEHILEAVRNLLRTLTIDLARDGAGARTLCLLLSRVDGEVRALDIGLATPSRNTEHVIRLFALRLDRLSGELETDFGFEAAALHVLVAEPLPERQPHLCPEGGEQQESLTQLVDRLAQRLGANAVRRLHPYQSHIPERSVIMRPPLDGEPDWTVSTLHNARPLLVLPRPEPADVMALVPEGPPRQFRWRGVRHQVTHAEGPERIAPEWWRQERSEAVRDYYVVEDEGGRRFWLYRAGLYREAVVVPRWFVQGVFA